MERVVAYRLLQDTELSVDRLHILSDTKPTRLVEIVRDKYVLQTLVIKTSTVQEMFDLLVQALQPGKEDWELYWRALRMSSSIFD